MTSLECEPPASRREIVAAFFIYLALATAVFFPFVAGNRTLQTSSLVGGFKNPGHWLRESDPWAGALQTEPELALDHLEMLRDRTFPLWNPYQGYGVPLAANMQSQPYSPFAWIAILWADARGHDVFLMARLAFAGFFAFLFARRFVGFFAALAGGAAYMFTGYLWLFLSLPQLSVEALTPALLYGVENVLRRPSERACAALATIAGASLLGGMPESSAFAALFAGAYVMARLASDPSLRARARASLPCLTLGAVLGVGISAIAVVPFIEYAGLSSNSHQSGVLSLLGAPGDPFTAQALAQYLAPLMFGPPTFNYPGVVPDGPILRGFFGAAAAFFASLALWSTLGDLVRGRRDALPVFFFALVTFVLLTRRFGWAPTFWIGSLPILHLILLAKYEEAIVACCVAAFVAAGVERLYNGRYTALEAALAFVVPLAILCAGIPAMHPLAARHAIAWTSPGALIAALAFLSIVTCLAAVRLGFPSVSPRALACVAFVSVACEIPLVFVVPEYYREHVPRTQAASTLITIPSVEYLANATRNGDRFYGEDEFLTPNWSGAFGIADPRDIDALYPNRYLSFVRNFVPQREPAELQFFYVGLSNLDVEDPPERRFLQLSSVRYIGERPKARFGPGDVERDAAFHPVFVSPYTRIYRFDDALPRVALYRHLTIAANGDAALRILRSRQFQPGSDAVVEGDASVLRALAAAPKAPLIPGTISNNRADDLRLSVRAPSTAMLVVNDTNFPGWQATVDGRPADIFAANYLFRGVLVEKGTHSVEFRYRPRSFVTGAAMSLVSAALTLWLWFFAARSSAKWRLRSA